MPTLSLPHLQRSYALFCSYAEKQDREPFSSFTRGWLYELEGYKRLLYREAKALLAVSEWKESEIGSGKILRRVLAAIEQPDNNLVQFRDRYGEGTSGHAVLLQAQKNAAKRRDWEDVLFRFYTGSEEEDAKAFQRMGALGCRQYPLITYLFFLKNKRTYVPNSNPEGFDKAFRLLGVRSFSTSRHCSWENYRTFLSLVAQTESFLLEQLDEPVDLLDAHSFLWVVANRLSGLRGKDTIDELSIRQGVELVRRSGDEAFTWNNRPAPFTLREFWQWSASDLTNNALRGMMAEFIVAQALEQADGVRVEWDAYDLQFRGRKIEVKSSAYVQSWEQEKPSNIIFTIKKTSESGSRSKSKRRSDIYVFCVLSHRNKITVSPLNLDQWEFFVVSTRTLNRAVGEQKSIALGSLLKLQPRKATFSRLRQAINATMRERA